MLCCHGGSANRMSRMFAPINHHPVHPKNTFRVTLPVGSATGIQFQKVGVAVKTVQNQCYAAMPMLLYIHTTYQFIARVVVLPHKHNHTDNGTYLCGDLKTRFCRMKTVLFMVFAATGTSSRPTVIGLTSSKGWPLPSLHRSRYVPIGRGDFG